MTDTMTSLPIVVITVSDTRTVDNDKSGDLLVQRLTDAGHQLYAREIVVDDQTLLQARLLHYAGTDADVVLLTGGTGITRRDVTPEAVLAVADKVIDGFGELFRYLSFQTIGASTIQSRAIGAVVDGTLVFALPGSTGACADGWDQILASQLGSRTRPCNFAGLMDRVR